MNLDSRFDKIVDKYLPAIINGQETVDSILDKYPQYADALRPRLEVIKWLAAAKNDLEPRPGFVSSSRKYLVNQLQSIRPAGFWQRFFSRYTPQRWLFNLVAPVIVLLLFALIINSAFLTARLSIPGDPLYTTKLLTEDIQVALTTDQVTKTNLYIQFSRERTTEFVELVLEGNYEALPNAASLLENEVIASLHALNQIPINEPTVSQSLTANLRETLTNEIFMLNVLKVTTPPSAHPGIEMAIQDAQSGLMALR